MPDGGFHFPSLVLNADFRPLSYFPLSTWTWQDTVKAVFLDRVSVLSQYEQEVRSPSFAMRLPSVVALRDFIPSARTPAFTRFNVFLRDRFACQYCSHRRATQELTFDHVIPRARGGRTSWENVVTACGPCNLRKGAKMPRECGMIPREEPR
ncbi:MAG: HNH endonuclease, partial [Rhodospirillales bacterium]|nr:HNH endonuclease [Rhodospirillales bacterium]MDE2459244.1 HNH endonuclease [Rhodospirillales bacterium]